MDDSRTTSAAPWPLRLTVPLALFLFVSTATWWELYSGRRQVARRVQQETVRDLTWTMTQLAADLERAARRNERGALQEDISSLAVNRAFKFAGLLDERGTVLNSMRIDDVGKTLPEVVPAKYRNHPAMSDDDWTEVQHKLGGRITTLGDDRAVVATYPIVLGTRQGQLRPSRIGMLVVIEDYSAAEARAMLTVNRLACGYFGLLSAFALGLGAFFHLAVTRRLRRLADVAQQVGAGNMQVRSGVGGNDEISDLARSIDQMLVDKSASERERAETEEQLQAVWNAALDAIITIDASGVIQSANQATEKLFGYAHHELVGKNVRLLMPMPYAEEHDDCLNNYLQTGQHRVVGVGRQVEGRTKEGTRFPIDVSISEVQMGDRTLFLGIARDIRDRQKAEQQEATLGRVLEGSLNEIFIFDAETLYFHQVNRGARNNLGYSMEELRQLTPIDLTPAHTRESFTKLLQPLISGDREQLVFDSVHQRKDQSRYDVNVGLQRVSYQGRDAFLAIILDVTKKKRLEEDLRQRDQAIATGATAIVFADLDGHATYVNRAFLEMWGFEHEDEVLGRPSSDFSSSPEDVGEVMQAVRQRGEWIGERLAKRKDGSYFEIKLSASAITDEMGAPISMMASFVDISDRVRAEEQLRVQQRAVEAAVNGILISDPNQPDNPVIYVNPAMQRITGYPKEEVIGRNCRFLQGADRQQDALNEVRAAIKEQRGCRVVLRNYRKNGTRFWNELTIAPVLDEQGQLKHFVGVQSDITEKKEAEDQLERLNAELESRVRERSRQLEEAQAELVRQEKLATLGQIAGGVAHEIRNPLGVIRNAVYYLNQTQTDLDEEAQTALAEISRGLVNSERIISELMDYARQPQVDLRDFSLDSAIDNALRLVRIPESVQVVRPQQLGIRCNGDQDQIQRLLANLLQNATQAMPDGGVITIRCDTVDDDVITEVMDTGIGIAAEEQESIFEPLFTKRPTGIGLGLSVCRRYAELNGGLLTVESEPGKGATFKLTLPLAD